MTKAEFKPIITNLASDDLYKETMRQVMLHWMPTNEAESRFVCRNTPAFPLSELADQVNEQLDHLCTLRYQEVELEYFGTRAYFKPDYIEFLRLFQLQRRYITVSTHGDTLSIVGKGPQVHVMGFEIYVLAIVNELYFRRLAAENGAKRSSLQKPANAWQQK
jgi:nicotinate phosphoribosyltransferase